MLLLDWNQKKKTVIIRKPQKKSIEVTLKGKAGNISELLLIWPRKEILFLHRFPHFFMV